MSNNKDIQIVSIFVILTIIFVLVPPFNTSFIRGIIGIPMVLFFPGYALIAALFPKKDDIDGIERLALSFGLSIAVVPLIGLGLNFTPFGIRLEPVLFSLCFFILIMCYIAYFRREKLPESEKFTIPFSEMYLSLKNDFSSTHSKTDKILTIILIISILISISMLIYVIVTPKQGEKFTEFYILGQNGKADNYSTQLEIDKQSSTIVGIVNREYALTNYTLVVSLQNDTLNKMDIQLMHNSTWEERVYYTPQKSGEFLKLQFLLYKEENFTEPYRDLHLWVKVMI